MCKPAYLVPVPAMINWDGCVRKASCIKMVGMTEVQAPISLDGVGSPSGLLVHLPVVSSFCSQKIQKMVKCTFWYQFTRVVPYKVQRAIKWLCVYPVVTSTAGMAWLGTPAVSRVAFDDCLSGIILQVTCLSLGSTNNVKALKEYCSAFV